MKPPELGRTIDGKPLEIDVDRLVVTRMLLQANSGAGKSWAMRRLLEQTHGRVQQLVIDVEDEYYTLRERFDYVLAGRDGDCPAEPRSAAMLARKLLELGTSAVLSIYELKAHERVQFVKLFLEALVDAPKKLWHPALVVLDEAHIFCPEKGKAESAGAVIDLMTRGRKRGFCGILATQRLAKLNKDAAAEANNKLIGRSALDVDMDRAAAELGFRSKDQQLQLRTLPDGNFFAFGPALSIEVLQVHVGAVTTSHQRAGEASAPAPPAREKVQKVLAQLADLPRQAEEEIRSLAAAQARIAALERELRAKPKPPAPAAAATSPAKPKPDPELVARVRRLKKAVELAMKLIVEVNTVELATDVGDPERAALQRAIEAAVETGTKLLDRKLADRRREFDKLKRDAERVLKELRALLSDDVAVRVDVRRQEPFAVAAPREPRPTREDENAGGLPRMHRAFLKALAQRPSGLQKFQVLLHAAYKSSGDTSAAFAALTRDGLIESDRGLVTITPLGRERLGPFTPLPKGRALRDQVLGELGRMEAAFMRVLFDAYPEAVAKGEILARAAYKSSGDTSAGFAKLVRIDYVVAERGALRAAQEFFEE